MEEAKVDAAENRSRQTAGLAPIRPWSAGKRMLRGAVTGDGGTLTGSRGPVTGNVTGKGRTSPAASTGDAATSAGPPACSPRHRLAVHTLRLFLLPRSPNHE